MDFQGAIIQYSRFIQLYEIIHDEMLEELKHFYTPSSSTDSQSRGRHRDITITFYSM